MVMVRQNAEVAKNEWDKAAWLLFWENKIFYHLVEPGSELQLTNFQERSGEPKSSILVPSLALWAVTTSDC
jgi:hypothetical protein